MARYEFDKKKPYRLIAVTDKEGRDKGNSHDFYEDRMNCVATGFHYDQFPTSHDSDNYRLNMRFVQNEHGLPIHRSLHTTTVWKVEEMENGIRIHTSNSIYTFENAELKEVTYQDAANLIEMYMSLEDNNYFGDGFYYDENKVPHALSEYVHVGMFQDSVLIHLAEKEMVTACRYFPMGNYVEFYDTLYGQQDYSTPMLIHNTGKKELPIRFQMYPHVWTIKPGESKRIIPFNPEGADPEEESEE